MGGSLFIFTLVFKENLSHFQPLAFIYFKLHSKGYWIETQNVKKVSCSLLLNIHSPLRTLKGYPVLYLFFYSTYWFIFPNFYWGLLSIRDEQGRTLIFIFPLKLQTTQKSFICFPLIHSRKFVEHMLCVELYASIKKKGIHRRAFMEEGCLGQHKWVLPVMQRWLK